jgi:glycosyltransferase involved in cell wall biosynthesis
MILIIQGTLPHYRRGVFNEMCKYDEVLVVHSGASNKQDQDKFRECILPAVKIGPFRIQKGLFRLIKREKPHVIIAMFDIRWVYSVILMYLLDFKVKWIWWGIGKGASKIALKIKLLIAKRHNPIVLYNEHSKQEMVEKGVNAGKCFVANNTLHVVSALPSFNNSIKNTFINIGSLDSRKQNDITIRAFKRVLLESNLDLRLVFIGDGTERKNLEDLAVKEGVFNNIVFAGNIENTEELAKYYRNSIASISFGQAGLAVLQSMAFGVPFVTKENAISGGEKYNIIHRENGIFCKDSVESLEEVMLELVCDNNFTYARELGKNAFSYYKDKASIENMVSGFMKAKDYSR